MFAKKPKDVSSDLLRLDLEVAQVIDGAAEVLQHRSVDEAVVVLGRLPLDRCLDERGDHPRRKSQNSFGEMIDAQLFSLQAIHNLQMLN